MAERIIPFIGRCLMAALFLSTAIAYLQNFQVYNDKLGTLGLPAASITGTAVVIFMILGSVMLITGYQARIGAVLLLIVMVPPIFMYQVLNVSAITPQLFKDLAVVGGLLYIVAYGPGKISLGK
ncbi:MAG: DoxX family protein [Chitinophagales bacterium]|nr:DoxX family protein [Chitinophagales bacterium]